MPISFFKFDPDKALQVILWIAKRVPSPGFHKISKIIYFADKDHLQRYGRQICGDNYVAMPYGPVPSNIYNILKGVKGVEKNDYTEKARKAFKVAGNHTVVPLAEPDEDYLSESDVECLDRAIRKYGRMNFGDLSKLGHDEAYESTPKNSIIDIKKIIKSLKDGESLLEYLEEMRPHSSAK